MSQALASVFSVKWYSEPYRTLSQNKPFHKSILSQQPKYNLKQLYNFQFSVTCIEEKL